MNLYIDSIEGGTFIARMGENSPETMLRDEYRNSLSFQSIAEIKEQLSNRQFDSVWLKQATPYDEMCGSDEGQDQLMIELDW